MFNIIRQVINENGIENVIIDVVFSEAEAEEYVATLDQYSSYGYDDPSCLVEFSYERRED